MTRSRTKAAPVEFTRVPFPVKALKLLVHELQAGGEAAAAGLNASDLPDDDEVFLLRISLVNMVLIIV